MSNDEIRRVQIKRFQKQRLTASDELKRMRRLMTPTKEIHIRIRRKVDEIRSDMGEKRRAMKAAIKEMRRDKSKYLERFHGTSICSDEFRKKRRLDILARSLSRREYVEGGE